MKDLKGKVAIVTGASSGIGFACCKAFAQAGMKVVMAARNPEKLAKAEAEIKTLTSDVLAVPTDVSVEEDCRNLIARAVGTFGGIDVMLNNAGISMRALFADLDLSVIRRLMETNFWGTVYCTKFAFPYVLERHGSIVGVSSVAGYIGLPGRTGYSASKFAMHGFLQTIRVENLKNDLHVMIVTPGFTASNIRVTALGPNGDAQGESPRDEGKMMTADEVACRILKGIRRRRRRIVLTFEGKAVCFLKGLCPALLDRLQYLYMSREPNSPFK